MKNIARQICLGDNNNQSIPPNVVPEKLLHTTNLVYMHFFSEISKWSSGQRGHFEIFSISETPNQYENIYYYCIAI